MAVSGENLLQRLSANEEHSIQTVLALRPESAGPDGEVDPGLTPRVRMLVRLGALVALDASTTCLRWAVELASCAGADDEEIVRVLLTVGPVVGIPQVISSAPRLAQAIGYEIADGADGS